MLGLFWDNGKEDGNYNLGFRVAAQSLKDCSQAALTLSIDPSNSLGGDFWKSEAFQHSKPRHWHQNRMMTSKSLPRHANLPPWCLRGIPQVVS